MRLVRVVGIAWVLSALCFSSAQAGVVINEIFYHAPNDLENLQWIELFNSADQPVDISGWSLDQGKLFTFPKDTAIAAQGYLIVALDSNQFRLNYRLPSLGPLKRPLKHGGGQIELQNAAGERVDLAKYKGKYDGGYEPIRAARFARLKQMGLINPKWDLSPQEGDWSKVSDKEWEARQGFIRAWVAHIFHMKTAADPFKQLIGSGWRPTAEMARPENYPIQIDVPDGPITLEGTRRNCRMVIEYVEGWLNGRGAKGIDSLEGKPGIHPALMEDLATGRMSVAQIAQRILHHVRTTDGAGAAHDFALVKRLLGEELTDIVARRPADPAVQARYRKSVKIAMRWIKNYVDLDFRSLASYTRGDLDAIAAATEAF